MRYMRLKKRGEKMSKKKGVVTITKEDLIKHANQVHKRLEFLKRAYELNERLKEIRIKGSRVLKPNFDFETTPEYEKYLRDKAEYDFEYWYEMEYLPTIEQLEEDLRKTNQRIQEKG